MLLGGITYTHNVVQSSLLFSMIFYHSRLCIYRSDLCFFLEFHVDTPRSFEAHCPFHYHVFAFAECQSRKGPLSHGSFPVGRNRSPGCEGCFSSVHGKWWRTRRQPKSGCHFRVGFLTPPPITNSWAWNTEANTFLSYVIMSFFWKSPTLCLLLLCIHLIFYSVYFWKAWPYLTKVSPKKLIVEKRYVMLRKVVLDVSWMCIMQSACWVNPAVPRPGGPKVRSTLSPARDQSGPGGEAKLSIVLLRQQLQPCDLLVPTLGLAQWGFTFPSLANEKGWWLTGSVNKAEIT